MLKLASTSSRAGLNVATNEEKKLIANKILQFSTSSSAYNSSLNNKKQGPGSVN